MIAQKETVIVVHGTWAGPRPDVVQWYQLNDSADQANFTAKLNHALEERGSAARCWAHCPGSEIFSWSGENTWTGRAQASADLAAGVNKLQAEGWRCHIVAHSHGGNIVAEALPAILASTNRPFGVSGSVITLGTPFVDAMTPVARSIDRRAKLAGITAWSIVMLLAGFALLMVMLFVLADIPLTKDMNANYFLWPYAIIFIVAEFWVVRRELTRPTQGWSGYWSRLKSHKDTRPFFLAIGSSMDEAWQILHHMRSLNNPLAITENIFSYLLGMRRVNAQRYTEVQRIQGATFFRDLPWHAKVVAVGLIAIALFYAFALLLPITYKRSLGHLMSLYGFLILGWLAILSGITFVYGRSFYSAVWSPFRWLGTQIRIVAQTPQEVGTYVVRQRAWSVLQQLAFGLEGYRYSLPAVERAPTYMPPAYFRYEDLPEGAKTRALRRRDAWISHNFGEATRTFSNLVVTSADFTSLLRTIESDLSLVHAAYYTDEECVGRIADWIARVAE